MTSCATRRGLDLPGFVANTIITVCGMLALLVAVYSIAVVAGLWASPLRVALLVVLPICISAGGLWVLLQRREVRLGAMLSLVSTVGALYVGEFFLITVQPVLSLALATGSLTHYDRRTKLQVIDDLRRNGIEAYPALHPKQVMDRNLYPSLDGEKILPLAGVADRATVLCNEWGKYYIYESDEYGFNNPPRLWRQSELGLALVGDSFTQGFCMPDGASFAERLRIVHPTLLNVGSSGNGPIVELASLREYLAPLQPKVVLWVYYEANDIEDLTREMLDPIASRYLQDPEFSQHLMKRAGRVDTAVRDLLQHEIMLERTREQERGWRESTGVYQQRFLEWAKLYNLRLRLKLANFKPGWVLDEYRQSIAPDAALAAFRAVLLEAKSRVQSWNGRLYFVYLPGYEHFAAGSGAQLHPFREGVLRTVGELGIPTLDITPAFEAEPDPLDLFPLRANLHNNERGNEIIANQILQFLKQQNLTAAMGDRPGGRAG